MTPAYAKCQMNGMVSRARWSGAVALLVGLSACMNSAPEDPLACGEDISCAASGELLEPPTGTPLQIPVGPAGGIAPVPISDPISAPTRPPGSSFQPTPPAFDDSALLPDPLSLGPARFDLFDIALLDPTALSDVLSLFLDDLILESAPPADLPNDLPFLERLCRETELPDFRCGQLYGE